MKDQMELFEDGGLKDEGGTVDEVSGNEVPIGGTKKGVRDDVSAMVSEGEFVFPEDVTRYIGLDKLMQMRQEAKMGLKRMEAMGQMGNSDEATIPDDMPFGMADLVIVAGDTGEELEMQEGGFVTRPTTVTRTVQQPTYTPPPQQPITTQPTTTRRLTPEIERPQRAEINFKELMGEASITYVEYRNEAGANMMIPHIGGVPAFPIPEGYTIYSPENEDSVENSNTEEGEAIREINETSRGEGGPDRDIAAEIQAEFDNAPAPINWDTLSTEDLLTELGGITGTGRTIANGAMLLFGPIGALGYAAMRDQDKKAYAAAVAKLNAGNLTAEERAELTAYIETLGKSVGPESKSILGRIVDGVAGAFGLSETKTTEAKTKVEQEEVVPIAPVETAPTPEEVLMQQPVTAAPVQTGDPEAFTYSPSVVDMKRPDTPITLGGGDPMLPSTTFAAAPTIPAPIDPYGVGQQGEFAGMSPPVMPSVAAIPQASPQKQSAKEYSDDLRSQGIIPSIADMQAAGYTDTEISSVGPASSPTALKVTIDKPTQTEDAFGIGQQGEFAMPSPVTPMAAGQQGAITATTPTGYDEAGLNVDPRRQQGPKQAEVFQTKEAQRIKAEQEQALLDTQNLLEQQKSAFADAEKRLAEQKVISAADIATANAAADARYNRDIAKIRADQTKKLEALQKLGVVGRAEAERIALAEAKRAEEEARRVAEAERKRIADAKAKSDAEAARRAAEDKRYKETLAATGTAERVGSSAPVTSIRPKARPKPTAKPKPAAKPKSPERSNDKSTRLDSSNPNTNKNITAHLSNREKESLKANPELADHYTATANRRANEAAAGDTSNTDSANEASDSSDKIVCTAMNNSYGFGSYRQAIWLSYSKDHLTKEHELGYHTLFLPLVDLGYNKNNKFVRTALEHIARHRTADLRASMQNKKRDTLGRIYRSILEPLVYTVGKFRTITGI